MCIARSDAREDAAAVELRRCWPLRTWRQGTMGWRDSQACRTTSYATTLSTTYCWVGRDGRGSLFVLNADRRRRGSAEPNECCAALLSLANVVLCPSRTRTGKAMLQLYRVQSDGAGIPNPLREENHTRDNHRDKPAQCSWDASCRGDEAASGAVERVYVDNQQ